MGKQRYNSAASRPGKYMVVSGKLHVAAALATGKEPMVSLEEEARYVAELVWTL